MIETWFYQVGLVRNLRKSGNWVGWEETLIFKNVGS